jgi:hypothetical protein
MMLDNLSAAVAMRDEDIAAAPPLTEREARAMTEECRRLLDGARQLLRQLKLRQGWRAMGYDSWASFVSRELGISLSQAYRQVTAGEIEIIISPEGNLRRIPERHLRPLAALRDDPDALRYAWQTAVHTAPEGHLTAQWVEATVKTIAEARTTGGYVDVYGEQRALNAAITAEAYEQQQRQRAALVGARRPLLNERYDSVEAAARALEMLAAKGAIRVLVYESE